MIQKIMIKNSPTFTNIELTPSQNFNVISGASGAGKSVLMESVLAIFGLRDINAEIIEATINLPFISKDFEGLIDEGEVIVTITKKDKIRYFINSQNMPKKRISELFSHYLQHLSTKSNDALSQENLFLALDCYCSTKDKAHNGILQDYKNIYEKYTTQKKELEKLKEESLKINDLKEFIKFEIQKIQDLNPKEGEYEELLQLKKELSKKEKILKHIYEVQEFLKNSHVVSNLFKLLEIENSHIIESLNELDTICQREEQRLEELDSENIEKILERIESLSALNHRYGGISEALEHLSLKQQELEKYENIELILKNTQDSFNSTEQELQKSAKTLHKSRDKHLKEFEDTLNSTLTLLKMPSLKVNLQNSQINALGDSTLELNFEKTNIKNLSSGEFNRLRLTLLLAQSTNKDNAIIILDELDANLSGEESEGVAEVLHQLSKKYQVFAISHQPHMPSFATKHFLVEKGDKSSTIKELDKDGRIQEIARMISGKNITKEAIEFAKNKIK